MATENKPPTIGAGDGILSSSQPTSGYQSAWVGVPGQVSMADIVKMGRPQHKATAVQNPLDHNNRHVASHNDMPSSEIHAFKGSDLNSEQGAITHQPDSPVDEWPSIEPSRAVSSVLETPAHSEMHTKPSNLSLDGTDQQIKSELDEAQVDEDGHGETSSMNHVGSATVSGRSMPEDDSRSSLFENNLYDNMGSYQTQRHTFEQDESESAAIYLVLLQNKSFYLLLN